MCIGLVELCLFMAFLQRLLQEKTKKRLDSAQERVYVQIATEAGAGRRYVDPNVEVQAKRGHRRAQSLNSKGLEKQRAAAAEREVHHSSQPELEPSPPAPSEEAGLTSSQRSLHVRNRRKAERDRSSPVVHVHIHSVPSATSQPVPLTSRPVNLVQRREQGHRRSNSWDPRKDQEQTRAPAQGSQGSAAPTKLPPTTAVPVDVLADVVAARKAELLAKERALEEKQARHVAELRTLARGGGGSLESEVEELLRLQRTLSAQKPILGLPEHVRAPQKVHEEADGELVDTLEGLNEELEHIKLRTLSIEKRVKELRCPGPTPLEMLTGMSQAQIAVPVASGADSRNFSSEAPLRAHVKRVAPRRSPDGGSSGDDRTRADSPNQAYAVGSLTKEGSKSAFSSFSPSRFTPSARPLGGGDDDVASDGE